MKRVIAYFILLLLFAFSVGAFAQKTITILPTNSSLVYQDNSSRNTYPLSVVRANYDINSQRIALYCIGEPQISIYSGLLSFLTVNGKTGLLALNELDKYIGSSNSGGASSNTVANVATTDNQLAQIAKVNTSNTRLDSIRVLLATIYQKLDSVKLSRKIISIDNLQTGLATAINQLTELAKLTSIDGKIPTNLTVLNNRLKIDIDSLQTRKAVFVTNFPAQISADSSLTRKLITFSNTQIAVNNLPKNYATFDRQDIANVALNNLDIKYFGGTLSTATVRATSTGTVGAGARFVSVFNAGTANATFNNATIKVGEIWTLPQIMAGTYGVFTYDATGSELVIITTK